jgi:flagellar basal-body rod protein FlgB
MATTPMLQALQGFLKVTTDRQQLVATNMANVDTPGYHTRDLDFQAALEQAMDRGAGPHLAPASLDVPDLPERPDGNNVNIDRESMILSQTQLLHEMGIQLVKEEFHRLLTAIKE